MERKKYTREGKIEGARNEGGKGDSIWDVFTDNKERVLDGSSGEVAVDHYHRYKEDIELMAKLGFGAYRFSISWSRIFPDGLGTAINEQGVAFYNNLIDFMIEKGIQPYATLYHWDLPHNLQKTMGGWLSDKIVEYFALYAEACFANFGDRVKHWITINEPIQTCINAYAAKQGGQVGFVIDCEWAEPMSDKMEDQAAAARRIDFQLGWFLDPIYFGDYPESMRQRVGEYLPKFSEKDRELMRNKIDFIGLNHYTTRIIGNRPNPQPQEIHFYQVEQIERSGMDDEDDPSAPVDQFLNDTKRVNFFKGYVGAVAQAIKDGADVRGYFAWSFVDNFEWAMGFTKRFGIVYVDYKNGLSRRPKASAMWFSRFLNGEAADSKPDTN
ncbi:Beta-glucosidase 4 [Triticum urartu]|uniref:Beta-glucosidase 4 n=2 Tax=Triticum TaxID=4564 RepID=M8APV4_TRIUA|nr:Beta-glucosidase 4 [Triticum urartu]